MGDRSPSNCRPRAVARPGGMRRPRDRRARIGEASAASGRCADPSASGISVRLAVREHRAVAATREVIRFFPDTGAEHPLWDEQGALYDLDAMPISAGLRAELPAWAGEANWNYLDHPVRLGVLR